jgi:glyoxylase-like metal-dependent hydrolase (beta-lactamase superfamily II)
VEGAPVIGPHLRVVPVGPLAANAVVLAEAGDAVLIDPGGEAARLLAEVDALDARLREVWLSHAHVDHLAGLADVLDARGPVPVRLHPDDRPIYEQAQAWAAALGLEVRPPPADPLPLRHGEALRVGDRAVRVAHLPGHAPGHVVFRFDDVGWVVAGDTLFRGGIGRTDLPGGDEAALLAGIRRELLTLPDATRLIPGHGPETTVGAERRGNPFLR